MCTPSAFGGRIVCIPSTPLFLAQLLVALGAASYFFLAGFLYNEFYEEVGQSPVAGLQLRTDTLDYAATVLGVNDTATCSIPSKPVSVMQSRFATAAPGAAPLNFTPSCSGLEAALTAAAAVGPSSDARLPTSVVRYEWLRVPAAGAADVAAMESLGFRVVPYAGGATGVRASGTVYRTDARLVTLEETLTVLADGQGSVGTSGEVEPYVGRESRFGFRLVTSSGAVSNGVAVPLQVAGVSLDVERTYDNLPVLERSPDPSAVAVTAVRWWQPTATRPGPGGASEAFDVSSVAATVRSRDETFGAVVRAVPSGRLVRFSYMELASLGVQSLVKYLLVWGAVLLLGVQCCPERVRSAVCSTVQTDGDKEDDGGDAGRADHSSVRLASTAAPLSAAPSQAGGLRRRGAGPIGGASHEDDGGPESVLETVAANLATMDEELTTERESIRQYVALFSKTVRATFGDLASLDRSLKSLTTVVEDDIRERFSPAIAEVAQRAARDEVVRTLTGKGIAEMASS
ncbi:hypothetical protein FNF28_00774 [Cafeteria roenbergensis]|uniref:Uncharacterized protein n=1 Tax=Cafeteria roenbergensis TaxID=33653 RepID=A0A5A8E0F8_CAFRO|nr:hypothetical protein FNF28_00774 [Cafeteria roenbergensis]